MRLRACMGGLLLAATGCAGLPGQVRLEVDGRAVEVRQNGLSEMPIEERWARSPDCLDPAILVVGSALEVEAIEADGTKVPLHRCPK